MEVITLQTEAYQKLIREIQAINSSIKEGGNSTGDFSRTLYSNEGLAKYLGVTTRTLQKYRDEGWLSFSKRGNRFFYRHKDVESFLDSSYYKAFKK